MKKLLWLGSILLVLGLLLAGSTTAIFANGPGDGKATGANEDAWEAMHEACEAGDWEAMTEAAEKVHGEDFESMPCHGYYDPDSSDESRASPRSGWGGHMGGGMMGW